MTHINMCCVFGFYQWRGPGLLPVQVLGSSYVAGRTIFSFSWSERADVPGETKLQLLCGGRYSSQHPTDTENASDQREYLIKYETKRRMTRQRWDLKISVLPRQTALNAVEKLLDGGFCWVWIQGVQGQVAGVALRLYQCRETRTTQSLLKLLEKLEESPEKERKESGGGTMWAAGFESQLRKAGNLTDGPSPPTVWLTRNWHHSIWRSWQSPEDSWDQSGASVSM